MTLRIRMFLPLTLLTAAVVTLGAQSTDMETVPVRGQVSMVSAGGVNALVQIGSQGVLVVDSMSEPLAEGLIAAIRSLAGSRPIRYVVNTHAHAEFTGGNLKVAAAGAQLVAGNFAGQVGQRAIEGIVPQAFVVAHENVLKAMSAPTGSQPPTPFGAWPTDTFFQDEKTMYFNGEGIQLSHVRSASTDGDILVFFRSSDVIAAGDNYSTLGYPCIDLARGGSVNGVIEGLNRMVYLTEPLVKTTDMRRNPRPLPPQQLLYPCSAVVEIADQPRGAVPHYLPGENPFLEEFTSEYKLPDGAARGGAVTMYPEFQNQRSARWARRAPAILSTPDVRASSSRLASAQAFVRPPLNPHNLRRFRGNC